MENYFTCIGSIEFKIAQTSLKFVNLKKGSANQKQWYRYIGRAWKKNQPIGICGNQIQAWRFIDHNTVMEEGIKLQLNTNRLKKKLKEDNKLSAHLSIFTYNCQL